MELHVKLLFFVVTVLISIKSSKEVKIQRETFTNEPCGPDFFRCDNSRCVNRNYRCDNDQDCGDGSDERNCSLPLTDRRLNRFELIFYQKKLAEEWLLKESETDSSTERWGYYATRTAVALYLANETYFYPQNEPGKQLAFELGYQLLARIALSDLSEVSSTELASFIHAFIVTCIDPRNFEGIDLVSELRRRVDVEDYINPFVMLALCNAGDNLTEIDIGKLHSVFTTAHREPWIDIQALAVMALTCATRHGHILPLDLMEMTASLKRLQDSLGLVDNIKTTALVFQALISANDLSDTEGFQVVKSLHILLNSQNAEGDFQKDILKTYFILPILNYRSLSNISSSHCNNLQRNENETLSNWMSQLGNKNQVTYSLWLGEDRYLERTTKFTVPANKTFYQIMKVAAQWDSKYQFKETMRLGKPYVYSVCNIEDDPENGKFWFLYVVTGDTEVPNCTLINKSPLEYIPQNDEHVVLWYRRGPWIVD